MIFDMAIAGPDDDPAIRRLLSENPMPGAVTVAFEREPDFFYGQGVLGDVCLTLKAVERESGRLAGVLSMASCRRYINGTVQRVGYIGGVRVDRAFQGKMLPLKAFPFIREQARGDWPHLWFGAIVHGNPTARSLFIDLPRTSFPRAVEVSQFHTLAILTRRSGLKTNNADGDTGGPVLLKTRNPRGLQILKGTQIGWDAIASFLNRYGSRREFFPEVSSARFIGNHRPPFPAPGDFLVASRAGEICGVCAVWDQSDFKQTVVHGYSGWLARARPLYNAAGPLIGMKRLPEIGDQIYSANLSYIAVRDDEPEVFDELLSNARADACSRGKDYLMAAFSVRDPLLRVAGKYRHILYRSSMYAFSFDGPLGDGAFNTHAIPYLEGAAL